MSIFIRVQNITSRYKRKKEQERGRVTYITNILYLIMETNKHSKRIEKHIKITFFSFYRNSNRTACIKCDNYIQKYY